MINRIIPLASFLILASLLQGALERDMPRLKSMTAEQAKNDEWLSKVRLSGIFTLKGKGFASLSTPEGNFWVEEGKFSSGYKLIELDTSQAQPSVLIQKGDRQAWVGLRSGMSISVKPKATEDELKKHHGIVYRKGESEPFTGTEIRYYKDGSKWLETPYVDGKKQGMEIQFREDGSKCMETPWVDGKRIGMEIAYREDGSKFSETPYVDGNANGTKIKYRQDGSKESETVYAKHNKQSGIWYREDGSKWKEMRYDIDPMIMMKSHPNEGIPTYYDENGIKKEEAPMVDGKLNGIVMDYYEDGSRYKETPYVNGKKHGTKIWYHEDGSKSGVVPYVKGNHHGTQTWYHKNGSKFSETPYVEGKKHGTVVSYHKDGSKKEETTWVKGKVNGTRIGYREDGSKSMETLYEKGKEISRKEF